MFNPIGYYSSLTFDFLVNRTVSEGIYEYLKYCSYSISSTDWKEGEAVQINASESFLLQLHQVAPTP